MPTKKIDKNILYIGDLNEGTRSLMRYNIINEIYSNVSSLSNTVTPFIAGVHTESFIARIFHKLQLPLDNAKLNNKINDLIIKKLALDIVFIEKSNMIKPSTITNIAKRFPESKIISLSEDDMYAKHNSSIYYRKSIKYYDAIFTTKKYNLHELLKIGASRTELFIDSFNEELHKPLQEFEKIENKDIDISFIGTFEKERSETLLWLAENGIKIIVYGNGWNKLAGKHPNLFISKFAIYGEEYVKTINRTKINLCFLRKINRDQVTCRSIEIPGCGGFLLAERTERHKEFFKEGQEAEFFSSNHELLLKINYYLKNSIKIIEIGKAGRKKCLDSGYTMKQQIVNIFNLIETIKK